MAILESPCPRSILLVGSKPHSASFYQGYDCTRCGAFCDEIERRFVPRSNPHPRAGETLGERGVERSNGGGGTQEGR